MRCTHDDRPARVIGIGILCGGSGLRQCFGAARALAARRSRTPDPMEAFVQARRCNASTACLDRLRSRYPRVVANRSVAMACRRHRPCFRVAVHAPGHSPHEHRRPPAAVLSTKNADARRRLCAGAERQAVGWGSLDARDRCGWPPPGSLRSPTSPNGGGMPRSPFDHQNVL
jgi:hypothetical protein